MGSDDTLVRERAYILWEQAGRPDGRSLEFWFAAVQELEDAAAAVSRVTEEGVLDGEPAFLSVEKTAAE